MSFANDNEEADHNSSYSMGGDVEMATLSS